MVFESYFITISTQKKSLLLNIFISIFVFVLVSIYLHLWFLQTNSYANETNLHSLYNKLIDSLHFLSPLIYQGFNLV